MTTVKEIAHHHATGRLQPQISEHAQIGVLLAEIDRLDKNFRMRHLGCLPILNNCRRRIKSLRTFDRNPVESDQEEEIIELIDQALGDASDVHSDTMDIHQMKSGEWWIEVKSPEEIPE